MFKKKYFENIQSLIGNIPLKNDSFFFHKKNIYNILSKSNSIILQKIDSLWVFPINRIYEMKKNNIGLVDYENKEILNLYLIEEYRCKGLGTFLMNEVEKKMKEEKNDSIHLFIHHNRKVSGFYEKLGYTFHKKHKDKMVYNIEYIKKLN